MDDLFGDLPKEPAAKPAEQPAEAAPAKKAAPEKPAAKPKSVLDDLFGDLPKAEPAKPAAPAEPKAEAAKPAAEPAVPQPKAKPADPFSGRSPQELPVRLWVDNTGKYSVRARLLVILPGKVRLLKETGKTATVPMRRLSQADQQYVERVAAQFGYSQIGQVAAR